MNKGILLIVLTDDSKTNLLQLVSPRYPTLFAYHVTLFYNVGNIQIEGVVEFKEFS